jgi:hypothetical protein
MIACKTLRDAREKYADNLLRFMREHSKARDMLASSSGASSEANWSFYLDCDACGRSYTMAVHASCGLPMDESIDWSYLEMFKRIPFKDDEWDAKVLAEPAKREGLKTGSELIAKAKTLLAEYETPLDCSIPTLQNEPFKEALEAIKRETDEKLHLVKMGQKSDLNALLRQFYQASARFPDDSQIIHMDGTRDGTTETEYKMREEKLRQQANAKLQSGATLYDLTQEELDAKMDEDDGVIAQINAKIRGRKAP